MWISCYFIVFLWNFIQTLPSTKGDAIAIPIRAASQTCSNPDAASPNAYQYCDFCPAKPIIVNGQIFRKVNPNLIRPPSIYRTVDSTIPSSKTVKVISSPVIVSSANNVLAADENYSQYQGTKIINIPESSKNAFPSCVIINITPSNCNPEIARQNVEGSSEICGNSTVVFRRPTCNPKTIYDYNLPSNIIKPQKLLRDIPAKPLRPISQVPPNEINNIKPDTKNCFVTPHPNLKCRLKLPEKPNVLCERKPISPEFSCSANSANNMRQVYDASIDYPNQYYHCQRSSKCDKFTGSSEVYSPNLMKGKCYTNIRPTYNPGQIVESKQIDTFVYMPQNDNNEYDNNALKFTQYNTDISPISSCPCVHNYPSNVATSLKIPKFLASIQDFKASPCQINTLPVKMAIKINPSVACLENRRERNNCLENNYCNEISPQFNINNFAPKINSLNPPLRPWCNTPFTQSTQVNTYNGPLSKYPLSKRPITSSSHVRQETSCNTSLKSKVPPSVPKSSLTFFPFMSSFLRRPSFKVASCPPLLPASLPEIHLPVALRLPFLLIDSKPECDPVEDLLKVMVCNEILENESDLDVLNPLIKLLCD